MSHILLATGFVGKRATFDSQGHLLVQTTLVRIGNDFIGQMDGLSPIAIFVQQRSKLEQGRIIVDAFAPEFGTVLDLLAVENSQSRLAHMPIDIGPDQVGRSLREHAGALGTVYPLQDLFRI